MGCCSPSAPPAPDYAGAATAQGAANAEAARIQGRMNNPNYRNPYGTQTVTWDGDTPTIDQRFSPEQQRIFDAQMANEAGMQGIAGQGIGALGGIIGSGLDLSGAPNMRGAYGATPQGQVLDQAQLPGRGSVYQRVDGLPQGPESNEVMRGQIIDAMMRRSNEDFGQREEQVNSDLVARGLAPGTEAYKREMDRIDEARNDARSQAELSADDMVSGAFGRDLSRQQNAYQQQFQDQATQFDQMNQNRGMATSEQGQRFNQQGQNAELGMRGQQQGYNQSAQNRQQFISELLAQRQTPLNEILALMGGSQVNNPFAVGGFNGNQQVAPAPIFGATQAEGQWNANRYNQQVGSYNNMMSGLFSLGSAALGRPSDIRLKSSIVKVGEHPLGIGIYEYDIFGHRERGVMAQELQEVMPEAVTEHPLGYLMVDYSMIGGRP